MRTFFVISVMAAIDFLDIWPSDEAHTVDALAAGGDEGRWSLRKASVRWQPTVITRRCPNGETRQSSPLSSFD